MTAAQQVADLLRSEAERLKLDLQATTAEVRERVADQMTQLASAAGEPGYDRAVVAARDNVALLLGIQAVKAAGAAEGRLLGIIQGALLVGGRMVAQGGT